MEKQKREKKTEASASASIGLPVTAAAVLATCAGEVAEKDWNFFFCFDGHVIARRGTRPRWLAMNRSLLLEVGRYFCCVHGYVGRCSLQIKYCYERNLCYSPVGIYGEIECNHMTQSNDLLGSLQLQASLVFILILSWSFRGLSSYFLASSVHLYSVTCCIFLTSHYTMNSFWVSRFLSLIWLVFELES